MLRPPKILGGRDFKGSIYKREFIVNIEVLDGRKKNVWLRVTDIENANSLFGMNLSNNFGMTVHGLGTVSIQIDFRYRKQQKIPHLSVTSNDTGIFHRYQE